ncbi:hypothetical protein Tco_0514434 [Tanacetum coccineum]
MKAMVFHQMDTEEVSDRFVAPCFVNGMEAYDGEINLEVEENMISNKYAVKFCLEHEFIINPEEDDVEPGVILRRTFLLYGYTEMCQYLKIQRFRHWNTVLGRVSLTTFYSTYEFDEVYADVELQTKKIIKFRLGGLSGRRSELTLLEFAHRLRMYHADELEEDGLMFTLKEVCVVISILMLRGSHITGTVLSAVPTPTPPRITTLSDQQQQDDDE